MVTLHPEPAPGHAARLGATLLGRRVPRKLTAAATAAAADRNLSPAPRGAQRRRGGGCPRARKSRGGPRGAGRRAREQQQQGPRFLPPRPGLLFLSWERAPLPGW
ncbi:uncharacterized protein LOC129015693 [Pongo pygmaeus]|uniref:uncharacterized protein LOC129015693 n=1 Tax=Pongo pygmaeus TaxID=9600 RepID=UPI0023E29543|nr:uncharacterized protein LOC129015693 [Pongo pygmaeus]